MRYLIACLLACMVSSSVKAQRPYPPRLITQQVPAATPSTATLPTAPNCMVKLIRSVRIPAEVEGMLTEIKVEEGNSVEAGQIIAVIDDKQALLMVQLKEAEETEALLAAENDVNLRDAIASEASARAEFKSYEDMLSNGAIPYWEVEKKRLDADRQKLRIELAELEGQQSKVQLIVKKRERELAELEVNKRQVKAPFAGYVETRIAQLGEWVQPGTPMFEVVQMDQLRIEGDIDAMQNPEAIAVGAPVKVNVMVSNNTSAPVTFDARLGFVSAQMDINGRRRIWVDVQNTETAGDWLIKPGMKAEIILKDNPELAKR